LDSVPENNGKRARTRYNQDMTGFATHQATKPDRDYRVFYFFMTLVIVAMYISTIVTTPAFREPWRLVVFSLLVGVHIALHWFLDQVAIRGRVTIYIIVQGALAFGIVLFSGTLQMLFGLFMPLLGELAGLMGLNRRSLPALLYYFALASINIFFLSEPGTLGWWILFIIPATIFTITYTMMYIRQAEARSRAQSLLKDLEIANRQLSEYAARVEDLTIASERQRMARELHDTLSQGLAGLILQLEAADAHLAGDRTERAKIILRQAMEKARSTLSDARLAIDDLRQAGPHDLGDMARQEADHFSASTGIPCRVEITLSARLPEQVNEAAARVVSEGLTNIARHAQAKSAGLRIGITDDLKQLEIEITDDGIGFEPEAIAAGHYGLLGMRERIRLAQGEMDVQSKPGEGTHLVIRFPLGGSRDD
jgi:two-component system, NarL family, sensor histidine kinase YdfH